MKFLVLFIICVASWVSLIKCRNERAEVCYEEGETHEKCVSDGAGYNRYKCRELKGVYMYIKVKKIICTKPQSACKCYENNYYEQECECINPRIPPTFPPTGVIRWNGTMIFDDSWWVYHEHPRTAFIPGEVHKDNNGRYLMKKSKVHWPDGDAAAEITMQFEIIIPNENGKTFTKYTGNGRSTVCTMTNVSNEGQLDSIWKKNHFHKYFHLISETPKSSNIMIQVWEQDVQGDDWDRLWKWTLEYDIKKTYAIPIKYYYRVQDGFGGEMELNKLDYFYEPISENDESFQIEDYCSNVKK